MAFRTLLVLTVNSKSLAAAVTTPKKCKCVQSSSLYILWYLRVPYHLLTQIPFIIYLTLFGTLCISFCMYGRTGCLFHHTHFHRDKFSDEELAENFRNSYSKTKPTAFTAPTSTAAPPQRSQAVLSCPAPVSSPSIMASSSSSSSKKKTENPPFPVALRRMISASTTPALQWTQDGSALSVDQTQVEEIQTLLQQYFPSMTTPTSLVRKMYSFGFRGMRREPGASTNSSSSHDHLHLEHDKESKMYVLVYTSTFIHRSLSSMVVRVLIFVHLS